MPIFVDMEKFIENQDFYNLKHCYYIKKGWERELNYYNKKIMKIKKESTKKICQEQINIAIDNLFLINLVIDKFFD